MRLTSFRSLSLCFISALAMASTARAQNLPLEPFHDKGQSITGAYEGWFRNQDGTYNLLFGYYNRNQKQDMDIPVGPNNRIEPGDADQGQPTHFLPGRQWGVFTVTVPADFGKNKLTWTINANGESMAIPASLDPLWEVSPLKDESTGNTPPTLRFQEGASVQGPRAVSTELSTAVSKPLALDVAVSDDAKVPLFGFVSTPGVEHPKAPPITVTWSKFRGPGQVTFADAKPAVKLAGGHQTGEDGVRGNATTTATFSEPGEYILLLVANDWSGNGGHGYQCCWTNAQVKVTVKP